MTVKNFKMELKNTELNQKSNKIIKLIRKNMQAL